MFTTKTCKKILLVYILLKKLIQRTKLYTKNSTYSDLLTREFFREKTGAQVTRGFALKKQPVDRARKKSRGSVTENHRRAGEVGGKFKACHPLLFDVDKKGIFRH